MSQTSSTPTAFITNLLTTLSTIIIPSHQNIPSSQPISLPPLPEEAKALLLTLHVLFPHALLDALDLLDRGRVSRLDAALGTSHHDDTDEIKEQGRWFVLSSQTPLINTHDENDRGGADASRWRRAGGGDSIGRTSTRYHPYNNTTSTQAARNDGENIYNETQGAGEAERNASIEGTSYHVHTQAWNCSCPAFAFAAFAGVGVNLSSGTGIVTNETGAPVELDDGMGFGQYDFELNERVKTAWRDRLQHTSSLTSLPFGGLAQSLGARDDVIPPTCKHLLACLLAEACPGLFIGGPRDVNEFGGIREGRKGVVVRENCDIEEVAAWAGGGVFV